MSERVFPALLGLALIGLTTSGVQPDYLVFGRFSAQAIQGGYGLIMLALAAKPGLSVNLHKVGSMLAMWIFIGKALGFLTLVVDGGTHLIGPVGERLVLACAAYMWHYARITEMAKNGFGNVGKARYIGLRGDPGARD